MRPGGLRAQEATQELRSSRTGPLACFLLHRPDRGRPLLRPPATREPSPLALARPLALRLLLGARRTLSEVAGVSFSFLFFFFSISVSARGEASQETLKGLLDGAQGFDEKQREGNTAMDLRSEFGKAIPGPFWEAESRRPPRNAAGFL